MRKMNATHELTTGEQRQAEKQQIKSRWINRRRDKNRINGEQRLRPVEKRVETVDEDLVGIDLRRVTKLSDLNIEN